MRCWGCAGSDAYAGVTVIVDLGAACADQLVQKDRCAHVEEKISFASNDLSHFRAGGDGFGFALEVAFVLRDLVRYFEFPAFFLLIIQVHSPLYQSVIPRNDEKTGGY
jgi:hypothetical protein